jgi:transglutaminase-like putative cysteine protease
MRAACIRGSQDNFFKVTLAANEAIYFKGSAMSTTSLGALFKIDLLDANQAFVKNMVALNATGENTFPGAASSLKTYANGAGGPADFYVRVWSQTGKTHDFKFTAVVVTREVTEVGFKLDHLIAKWPHSELIDSPDGTLPTWVKDAIEQLPASYTKGVRPTLFAKLAFDPPYTQNISARVRVKRGGVVLGTRTGLTFTGDTGVVDSLPLTVDLEGVSSVKASDYLLDWELSTDGGSTWSTAGRTGPHRVYWTYAIPLTPPFGNMIGNSFPLVYDRALEIATNAAAGATDEASIKGRLNTALREQLLYDPNEAGRGRPLFTAGRKREQCDDISQLMRGLLRSIGIDAQVWYLWGGGFGPGGVVPYWYEAPNDEIATFRVERPEEDDNDPNPHFTFHAVVGGSGTSGTVFVAATQRSISGKGEQLV